MITRGLLFTATFGISNFKGFKGRLPAGAYKGIKSLGAHPTTNGNRTGVRLPDNGDGNLGGTTVAKKPLTAEALSRCRVT